MKTKKYNIDLKNFCGLDYLTLLGCPVYDHPEYGQIIDLEPIEMEQLAAKTIIIEMLPIRGKEVKLMRSSLGLSLEKFAREFKISSSTVLKWERAVDERLSLANEIIVRLFVAEKLKCILSSDYSKLINVTAATQPILIKTA
jgi:DNA-binding transcriptional regulator YiaG